MSIQAVAWALEQDMPARPKLVLVSIANHASHTDGYCWLKAETIAAEAACTPRSVYRFIGGLVRNGYLRKAPRKGDDGKQRANDYWLLLQREPKEWDWGAELGSDAEEPGDEAGEAGAAEPQDVVQPHDRISHGEGDVPHPIPPVDKHAVSPGPCDNGVSRIDSAEPSKIKPEESRAGGYVPRAYRPPPPPPPQPLGSVVGAKAERIFVFEGSRAYDEWAMVRARESGVSHWHLVTSKIVAGEHRRGWYFPSLFPPKQPQSGRDPPSDGLPDSELAYLK